MNMRFLFLAMLVVFSLGCAENSPSATAGAEIKEFAFDTSSATDKDTPGLFLKIENVGAKTMDGDSKLWLYNVPFGEGAWRLESVNGDKSNKAIITDGEEIPTKNFFPFDIETGSPSAAITREMLFAPPRVPLGMKESYEFTARLCYPYRTTSSTTLVAVSPTEFRVKTDKNALAETINSAGPLGVAVKSDNVIRSGGRIPIPFIITNVGAGYSTARAGDKDCKDEAADTPSFLRNRARLTVLADGEATDCKDMEIALDSGGKVVVWCNFAFSGQNPKQETHLTATLTYNYFATKAAKIEVQGVLGEAEQGISAGAGGVVVATLVRDICEKAGQIPVGGTKDNPIKYARAVPVCIEKDPAAPEAFDYPGTTVSVLAQPPACDSKDDFNYSKTSDCNKKTDTGGVNRAAYLKDALGSRYDKATIRTLNTHDLSAKDLNLGALTLSDIDSWFISTQYTKSMLKDKGYLVKKADSTTEDYVKPLGILDFICTMKDTDNSLTATQKVKDVCKTGVTANEIPVNLVLKKDTLKEKGTPVNHSYFNPNIKLSEVVSINGMTPPSFLNQPIYGLKITSINGWKISDMTKNTVGISEINLEDFYLKYLIAGDNIYYEYKTTAYPMYEEKTGDDTGKSAIVDTTLKTNFQHNDVDIDKHHTSLLDHIKCDSTTTYTQGTHAFCVTAVGKYNGADPPFPKFSGTSSSECSTKCKSFGSTYLGACNSADKVTNKTYECKGRSIIVYGIDATQPTATAVGSQYGCSDHCLCYRTEKADLTSAENMLLCEK